MSADAKPVTVTVLGKEYLVACPKEERDALLASADLLNNKISDVQRSGRVVGMDRITVMAALNIAHELLQLQVSSNELGQTLGVRLNLIQDKIESALGRAQQMEL